MSASGIFADLEVRISALRDGYYPVDLDLNNEQQFGPGRLDPAARPELGGSPAHLGQALFDWLLADPALGQAWAEIRGQSAQRRVRLRLDATAPELHALPWELLREGADDASALDLAAADSTPFSRYLAGKWQPGSPILSYPIKILVAIAAPENLADSKYRLSDIDPDAEWDLLQQATADLQAKGQVKLIAGPQPCTVDSLDAALRESGAHILHYIGHGGFNRSSGQAMLVMADEENQADMATDDDLTGMVKRQLGDAGRRPEERLRLVFLASCQTAARSQTEAFHGLAPKLIAAGLPAVVAMQDFVSFDTARAFSERFYRQLLSHGQVDLACNQARAHLLNRRKAGAAVPALFMRLPQGQLLGQRGQISSDRQGDFWPKLLANIERGACIPFLGPKVNQGLLPGPRMVARILADKFKYPLADGHDLARVAQFIALDDPALLRDEYIRTLRRSLFTYLDLTPTAEDRQRFKTANLTETAAGLSWAETVLTVHEYQLHHLLADLRLPLYVTTNVDSFMLEALAHKGLTPQRIGLQWQKTEAGTLQYTLPQAPDPDHPVVLHLNGYDADPLQQANLVLSEEDYLEHFIRLSREQDHILPAQVNQALSKSSFLFLGYDLNDWEFRVVIQGLIRTIEKHREEGDRKLHVGVQLEVTPGLDTGKVITYLRRYLQKRFNIEVYWGAPQQFVTELQAEWQTFHSAYGDEIAIEEEYVEDW